MFKFSVLKVKSVQESQGRYLTYWLYLLVICYFVLCDDRPVRTYVECQGNPALCWEAYLQVQRQYAEGNFCIKM